MKNIKYYTMLVGAGSAIFSGAFAGAMIDAQMMNGSILIKNSSFENDILAFAKITAMAQVAQDVTEQITVGLELGNLSVDPSPQNGDEYLLSVVDKCSIHSEDNFEPMCFICKLSDSGGKLLAQGIVGDSFDKVYVGSSTLTIDLQADPSNPYSNQVEKVQNIKVQICGPLDDSEPQGITGELIVP
jgi:hypothetical protein